jgi:hypothetical protein
MDVVGAWALDNNGPQTMIPTKTPNSTRDVKRGLDLRNVILIVSYLSSKTSIWTIPTTGRGY